MQLAVRFSYYMPGAYPSCNIMDLSTEQWEEFLRLEEPRKRRDWMINYMGMDWLYGKVKELWWIPLDNQDKLSVQYRSPKYDEWRQLVVEEIHRLNSRLSTEDWEEIESDLDMSKNVKEGRHLWDWREVAENMLL